MTTLTAPELARQALVLFVDGGEAAARLMDEMEKVDHIEREQEEAEQRGEPDNLVVPEGMNIRELAMGVIPGGG